MNPLTLTTCLLQKSSGEIAPKVCSYEWKRFGLFALKIQKQIGLGRIQVIQGDDFWFLLFDWNPQHQKTAWDSLIDSLSNRQVANGTISLAPHLLLPLMFITRMADHPRRPNAPQQPSDLTKLDVSLAGWLKHLVRSYEPVTELLTGYFAFWARFGTSQEAIAYRERMIVKFSIQTGQSRYATLDQLRPTEGDE